jgi:hypothetical protein
MIVRMFDTNVWIALVGTFMLFYVLLYVSKNYAVDGQRSFGFGAPLNHICQLRYICATVIAVYTGHR